MKNPNPKNTITPEQEEQFTQGERLHLRAEILTHGCAELLKRGEWCGTDALEECARALTEAANLRHQGYMLRDARPAAPATEQPAQDSTANPKEDLS